MYFAVYETCKRLTRESHARVKWPGATSLKTDVRQLYLDSRTVKTAKSGQKQSHMQGVQNGGEILWKLNKSCNIVTALGSVVNLEINIFNLQSLKGSLNSKYPR